MIRSEALQGTLMQVDCKLHVTPGLHVLRYERSEAGDDGPIVTPVLGPEAANKIKLIWPPGRARPELAGPGARLVVVAEIPGIIQLKVVARRPKGSLDALLRLELLEDATSSGAKEEIAPAQASERLRLLAHVSRRGDVEIGEGDWAGGPAIPAILEGLTVVAGAVQARVLSTIRGQRQWSPWASPGTFLGSRGQSQALFGLGLRIENGRYPQAELTVEALFVGSPIVKKRGRAVELVGPHGRDALVGLRVEMVQAGGRELGMSRANALAPEQRLQVFRPRVGEK